MGSRLVPMIKSSRDITVSTSQSLGILNGFNIVKCVRFEASLNSVAEDFVSLHDLG